MVQLCRPHVCTFIAINAGADCMAPWGPHTPVCCAPRRCVLVGIAPGAPERPQLVKGFMQLYSVEQSRSQVCSTIGLLHLCTAARCMCGGHCHCCRGYACKE